MLPVVLAFVLVLLLVFVFVLYLSLLLYFYLSLSLYLYLSLSYPHCVPIRVSLCGASSEKSHAAVVHLVVPLHNYHMIRIFETDLYFLAFFP